MLEKEQFDKAKLAQEDLVSIENRAEEAWRTLADYIKVEDRKDLQEAIWQVRRLKDYVNGALHVLEGM